MNSRSLYFSERLRRDLSAKMKTEVATFRSSRGVMVVGEYSSMLMLVSCLILIVVVCVLFK